MKKLKIIIIDSRKRGKDIFNKIQRFNDLSQKQSWRYSIWQDTNMTIHQEDIKIAPDLFLIHINDLMGKENVDTKYVEEINGRLKSSLIILYSGGSISINEKKKNHLNLTQGNKTWKFTITNGNQICIIARPIARASDLNIESALEKYITSLSNYDQKKAKEIFFQELAPIKMMPKNLIALSILCQGYLAVLAAQKSDLPEETKVAQALELMGWPAFTKSDEGRKVLQKMNLAGKIDEVSKPTWWNDVFALDKSEFEKTIAKEWELKSIDDCPIKTFLDSIYGTDKLTPELVADVFISIAKKLQRKKA